MLEILNYVGLDKNGNSIYRVGDRFFMDKADRFIQISDKDMKKELKYFWSQDPGDENDGDFEEDWEEDWDDCGYTSGTDNLNRRLA